jgi:hypothetical protein
VREN